MNTKNKKANPKLSVIITCYNYGKFIDEAIESVENQTFRDYELIIIDDCSTDEFTKARIKHLSYISYINMISLKKNVGVCKARNLAAKEARGEYIMFLDADDKLNNDFLEKTYTTIKKDKFDIVGCGFQFFGKNNKIIINQYDKTKFFAACQLPAASLIRKALFIKMKGFRENMHNGMEDHDLWLGLIQEGARVHIIQEVLFRYRVHSSESRGSNLELDRRKFRNMQENMVRNNPKIFLQATEYQKKQIRKFKKINTKLKITVSLSLIFNTFLLLRLCYS